jgi:putative inorganic carbon (hco3(-)) transporter
MEQIKYNKITNVFMMLLVCAMPLSIALTNFLWILLLLMTIYKFYKYPDMNILKDKINIPILIFVAITILSIIFSTDVKNSIFEIRKTGQMLLIYLFWFNINDEETGFKLIKTLFTVGVLVALFGIFQYVVGIDSWWADQGFIYSGPNIFINHIPHKILNYFALADGRVKGLFSIYLTFAEVLALIFSVSFCLFLYKKSEKIISKSKLLFYFIILVCILLTYCRGVWISLIMFFILIFILEKNIRMLFLKIAGLILVFLLIFSYFNISRRSIIDRFKTAGSINKNIDRISMWQSGYKMVKDYPVFGIGPRQVPVLYPKYVMPTAYRPEEPHLHSNFVNIAAERGLLGLASFLFMFGYFLFYFFKFYLKPNNEFIKYNALAGICVVLVFLIFGATEYCFGDAEVIILFWSILGILLGNIKVGNKSL